MRRKKTLLHFILFCQFLFSGNNVFAQCGVTPGIVCDPAGFMWPMRPNINAGATVFDPGWVAYDWKWERNNTIISLDSLLNSNGCYLPDGFSKICLTVSATNSSTGDSCTQQICNIFQSNYGVFLEFDCPVNGYNVSFQGSIYAIDSSSGGNIDIDWGDGYVSSPFALSDTHTYAAPGAYVIRFTYGGYWTERKVQIDNGNPNMNVSSFYGIAGSGCYPATVAGIYSSPPYISGEAYLITHAMYDQFTPIYLTNGDSITFPMYPQYPVVPGQAMIGLTIEDVNAPAPWIERYTPMFFDVCNVVPDTIRGIVFDDQDADGLMDAGEPGIPNKQIRLRGMGTSVTNYYELTDSSGNFSILAPNASFRISPNGPSTAVTFPPSGVYDIDGAINNTFPLYNFGIANLNTQISGRAFLDFDQDSVYDGYPERGFPHVTIKVENSINGLSYHQVCNSNGIYIFELPSGNYTITATESCLDSASHYPDSIFVNSTGGFFSDKDFGYYSPVDGNFNLRISGSIEARPGFDYSSSIGISNTGFDTIGGTFVFNYDSLLTVSTISPFGGVIDIINHTVTWSALSLPPIQKNNYIINYTIPTSTPLGTVLHFNGQVSIDSGYTDIDLLNNTDNHSQTVIGSYDPNDKKVDPGGYGPTGDVYPTDRLYYTIRFQNTGTASAINIIVQDELDPQLDLSTFQMEDASHNYDMVATGNTFTWRFYNINLPDSNTNEPNSHGYIEYSLKPLPGLPDGTTISNTADIYFDFNAPVVTNTVVNTLYTNVGIAEYATTGNLQVFPNPAKDLINIRLITTELQNVTVELLDVTGKVCKTVFKGKSGNNLLSADLSGLTSGIYFIRAITEHQVYRVKLIMH